MNLYQIQITRTAKQDLKEIVSYVSTQLKERGTAQKLYQAIRENVLKLDHMPERYPLYEDEPWHSCGLRKLLVNHYFAFYLVNHEQNRVQVIRVIYAGRDIATQLQETDWDNL